MGIIVRDAGSWIVAFSVAAFVVVGTAAGIYLMICGVKDHYQERREYRKRRENM